MSTTTTTRQSINWRDALAGAVEFGRRVVAGFYDHRPGKLARASFLAELHPATMENCSYVFTHYFGDHFGDILQQQSSNEAQVETSNNHSSVNLLTPTCDELWDVTAAFVRSRELGANFSHTPPRRAMGPAITITFEIAYILVIIISILLNIMAIYGIWSTRKRIKGIRLYLFSLTAANVFITLTCAPFTLAEFIDDGWRWGAASCSIVRGAQVFSVDACVIIIVAITIER